MSCPSGTTTVHLSFFPSCCIIAAHLGAGGALPAPASTFPEAGQVLSLWQPFCRQRPGATNQYVTAEQLQAAGCWVPPETVHDSAALADRLRAACLDVTTQLTLLKLEVQLKEMTPRLFAAASAAAGAPFWDAGVTSGAQTGDAAAAAAEPPWLVKRLATSPGLQQAVSLARAAGGQLIDEPGQLYCVAKSSRSTWRNAGITLPSGHYAALLDANIQRLGGRDTYNALGRISDAFLPQLLFSGSLPTRCSTRSGRQTAPQPASRTRRRRRGCATSSSRCRSSGRQCRWPAPPASQSATSASASNMPALPVQSSAAATKELVWTLDAAATTAYCAWAASRDVCDSVRRVQGWASATDEPQQYMWMPGQQLEGFIDRMHDKGILVSGVSLKVHESSGE